MENRIRNAFIHLCALPEQLDQIDRAVTLLGTNRANFILGVACERAQNLVLDQVLFGLDRDKFASFTALLDAPVNSNLGLERLMDVKTHWET